MSEQTKQITDLLDDLDYAVLILEQHVQYDNPEEEPSGEAVSADACRRAIVFIKKIDRLEAEKAELLEIAATALNWWHADDSNFEKEEPEFIKLVHKLEIAREAALAKAEGKEKP